MVETIHEKLVSLQDSLEQMSSLNAQLKESRDVALEGIKRYQEIIAASTRLIQELESNTAKNKTLLDTSVKSIADQHAEAVKQLVGEAERTIQKTSVSIEDTAEGIKKNVDDNVQTAITTLNAASMQMKDDIHRLIGKYQNLAESTDKLVNKMQSEEFTSALTNTASRTKEIKNLLGKELNASKNRQILFFSILTAMLIFNIIILLLN